MDKDAVVKTVEQTGLTTLTSGSSGTDKADAVHPRIIQMDSSPKRTRRKHPSSSSHCKKDDRGDGDNANLANTEVDVGGVTATNNSDDQEELSKKLLLGSSVVEEGRVGVEGEGDVRIDISYSPGINLSAEESPPPLQGSSKKQQKHKDKDFSDETFGFDWIFIRRFFRLHRVLFLRVTSLPTTLFLFLLTICLLRKLLLHG
jgi:hypothetical protein